MELTLTLTLPRTRTIHQNLSLPRSLILHLSRLLAWAHTSALEGDHESGVASALASSLDRTLTLAKALSSWGPNNKVGQHHAPGVQKRCRLTRHGTWNLTMSFPRPGCSSREDSGGLLDQGLIDVCGLDSQGGTLTGTVPCALNSALRGDHCPAVSSAPGTSWDLTLTLTLPEPFPSTET